MKKYLKLTEWQKYKQLLTIYRNCLVIGCGLQFFQQFVGINTIMYYGPEVIKDSGLNVEGIEDQDKMGIILFIPLAVTVAVGCLIAIFVIDSFGRRYIMLRFIPGLFLSMVFVSISMYFIVFYDDEKIKSDFRIVFITFIVVYLLSFSIGFSSTPWTVQSEIFPIHLIGTGVALCTATNWASNFIVASVFLTSMESDAGKVYTFAILAFNSLLAFLFVYFLVPETANKRIYQNVRNIVNEKWK